MLTAQPTGTTAIQNGRPLKQLGDPVFFEYNSPAFDRHALTDQTAFIAKVTEIIKAMHADGTLKQLSMKWYGADYTTSASTYVLGDINK